MDFFRFELFLNSSATDIVLVTLPSTAVETAIARCTSRCAMARGHRLKHLHCSGGGPPLRSFLSGIRGRAFTLSSSAAPPLRTPSPSLISHLASVDVKQIGQSVGRFYPSQITFHHILTWPAPESKRTPSGYNKNELVIGALSPVNHIGVISARATIKMTRVTYIEYVIKLVRVPEQQPGRYYKSYISQGYNKNDQTLLLI